MPISVTCSCGKRFRVRDDLAGKKVKCPECGHSMSVSSMDDDEDDLVASVPPTRKPSRKSKPQKKKSSPLTAVLIGAGATALLLVGCCSGVGIWFQRSLQNFTEQAKADSARRDAETKQLRDQYDAERRARGEAISLDDYPPVTFDAELTASFTQEVSMGKRTIRIPADFRPVAVPPHLTPPPHISQQVFEQPYAGPLSNILLTLVTDTLNKPDVETLSVGHHADVSEYILVTKFLRAHETPTVYGRMGDFLMAQTLWETKSPDGKPMKVLYMTIGDGFQTHSVIVMGFAADDKATLQQFEAIIATLH